jgi:tRNA A37 threonylcarbamoyladenosine modification protein TsaB
MKVKISKLTVAIPSLKFLAEQTTQAKTAYKLAKFLNAVSSELDIAETTRKNLIKTYNLENKESLEENSDNLENFKQEMTKLMDEEVEINMEPLSINELGGMPISVSHMMNLDFMFKE